MRKITGLHSVQYDDAADDDDVRRSLSHASIQRRIAIVTDESPRPVLSAHCRITVRQRTDRLSHELSAALFLSFGLTLSRPPRRSIDRVTF